MIDETLRKFCESPRRWLIVTALTFVVGLVLILPLVDAYRAGSAEKTALFGDVASARATVAGLDGFEARVTEKLAQLQVLEARTVDEDSLPALRTKLVDLAKETGCSIRRLSVGSAASRPWVPTENPIAQNTVTKPGEAGSGFLLEWRPVNISLSGSGASLRNLMERVSAAGMMVHAKSVEMYPSSPTPQILTLDMELWYFTLARKG